MFNVVYKIPLLDGQAVLNLQVLFGAFQKWIIQDDKMEVSIVIGVPLVIIHLKYLNGIFPYKLSILGNPGTMDTLIHT